jgi:hypothetical protein
VRTRVSEGGLGWRMQAGQRQANPGAEGGGRRGDEKGEKVSFRRGASFRSMAY